MKGVLLEKILSYTELDKKKTKILIIVAECIWFLDEIKDGDFIPATFLGILFLLTIHNEYKKWNSDETNSYN